MKAYGIPRIFETEYPDRADLLMYGRARFRTSNLRKRVKRIWKGIARAKAKEELNMELKLVA